MPSIGLLQDDGVGAVFKGAVDNAGAGAECISVDGFNAGSQPIASFIDNANLSVLLPFGLSLTPSVEFYHTRSEGRTDNFVLLDCSLGYTFRKVKFSLDVNNILNTDSFIYYLFLLFRDLWVLFGLLDSPEDCDANGAV